MERKGNLIIQRGPGESFTIGDDITITVLSGSGGQTRLSIEAPTGLKILRDNAVKHEPRND